MFMLLVILILFDRIHPFQGSLWAIIRFWNFDSQLRLYLSQITNGQRGFRLYQAINLTIISYFFIIITSLCLLSPEYISVRLALYDPMLFLRLPATTNWIMALFALDGAFFLVFIYSENLQ